MTRWIGLILAPTTPAGDEMASRLTTHLHPVAGRPLIWHVASALCSVDPAPARILVVAEGELDPELFADLAVAVHIIAEPRDRERSHLDADLPWEDEDRALVVDAAASVAPSALSALMSGEPGGWLEGERGEAVAAWLSAAQVGQIYRLTEPLAPPNGVLGDPHRVDDAHGSFVVHSRAQLGTAVRRIRDRLLQQLMAGGVTFLLPESVLVDVDVRIGADTIVYPGAVIEGQTTIGAETVVGPGCRIISSWIGSGVELKGWNYISHASLRNRAILEPYVRRGYD